ncbi:helix-turn-helix transcriptional regulator [Conexibacter sp. CPCC 206217]|uniref:helix-turn-helix transcriptional regulator n=1 Tax=Conexibacter sp. CPCC 206217 TaxID=3064574 RepID=UPI00271A75E2|nr:helix-turn-helix transcriptional regulator [Conexibacter sp. CPCC 206217]MDO8213610.1 helix-turn-helix transcriptional regulator [Conexibacter sp. CPCC 206217]
MLSTVIAGPGHGYDVGARMEDRFGGVVRSSHRHAHEHLRALEGQGLVEAVAPDAVREFAPSRSGRATGNVFRATRRGVEAWRDWLTGPLDETRATVDVLVRLRAVRPGDLATMRAILDAFETCVTCAAGHQPLLDADAALPDLLGADLTGAILDAQRAWIRDVRARLHDYEAQAG